MGSGNETEYGALRRILQLSAGTSTFTTVACNSPAIRESLCHRLRAEGVDFHEVHLALGATDPVADTLDALPAGAAGAVFIIGLDYLLAETTPGSDHLLAVLNRSRERWRAAFHGRALVFWLTQHTAVRLFTHAPDLRAWVSHELEFLEERSDAGGRMDHSSQSRNYTWLYNLGASAKRARLVELEQRISLDAPDPALFLEWARSWDERLTLLRALGENDEAERYARALLLRYPPEAGANLQWRAGTFDHLANLLVNRGELDEALRIRREEELPLYEKLGAVRSWAVTMGQIADILSARGELDEALRIRREEELPLYEKLGDVWSRAVTLGKIADILSARGELDEALRIRREEQLPLYEKLGDVRSRAVTMGKIAEILSDRGELDEALWIRREVELPVFEKLGDVRSRAVTLGQIADILRARGQLDEALRIHLEEELPVYESVGDLRARAVTQGKIAAILGARGQLDEALRILRVEVLPVFEKLGDARERVVTLGKIADILRARGELDEALRILRVEVLPVFGKLGTVRELIVGRVNVAQMLAVRGRDEDGLEVAAHLAWAWREARRMGLPEAALIEEIAERIGLKVEVLAQVASRLESTL